MLYNMACYHARLGQLDKVIPCLQRAIRAGYRKLKSYATDPDLAAVRNRADFQALLKALQQSST